MINQHYIKRYRKFIQNIKSSEPRIISGYTETHHILPRCLHGKDTKENLIKLTPREHFLAHWLLWKAYPDYFPLASAFLQMNNKNPKLEFKGFQGQITSRTYQRLKTEVYNRLKEYTANLVRIKDQNGNTITLSSEEYANQTEFEFHTKGMVYVLDTVTNKDVYISTKQYHQNKDRYSLSKIDHYKYCFLDQETNQILRISKSEAREKNKEYGYKRLKNVQKKNLKCVDDSGNIISVPLEEYDPKIHKFYLKGTVNVYDISDCSQKIISVKDYYLNKDRYLTSTKGKVLAKDQNGNKILVSKKEFNSGGFVGQTKGLTMVKDNETGKFVQVTQEEYRNNKNRYNGPASGKLNIINKLTGLRSQISKDEFDSKIHLPLGSTKYLFLCRNLLTKREKNINIYEWHLVKNDYEIIDKEKFQKALALIS
jgi:hypothetical protein